MAFDATGVTRWLATHHGVVTRQRARRLGMSDDMIRARLHRGEWVELHRGVYATASSGASPERALLAAVAAAGPGSTASHLSAAWLWAMTASAPTEPWVTVRPECRRRLRGVRSTRSIDPGPTQARHGLPCTPAARTLIDCAAIVDQATLSHMVDRALAVRAVDLTTLRRVLGPGATTSRRKGRAALRANLVDRSYLGGPAPSVLESGMARLLNRLGLPPAQAEVRWSGPQRYRLDFAFSDRWLAVEVDGYAWHASPERMRSDQRRRNALVRGGWTLLVYTWRDVTDDAARVGAEISAAYRVAGQKRPA